MAQRPGLSDFMQLAQGFGNIAQQHQATEAHGARMDYMDEQQAHMTWQRERAGTEDARRQQVGELAGTLSDQLLRGTDIETAARALPADVPADVRHDATIDAMYFQQQQHAASEAQLRKRGAEISQQYAEFDQGLGRAQTLLQTGDVDGFYDMAKVLYNNYVYDGQRVRGWTDTDEGRVMEIETVDGQVREIEDDFTPEQVLELLMGHAADPQEYFGRAAGAKNAVTLHNSESLHWENLERTVDPDGNILYVARQIDPQSFHPVKVYLEEGPDGVLRPVDAEGKTAFSKEAMGLKKDAREMYGHGIENLNKNQARSELEKFFFREGGLLGEIQRMTDNPEDQYRVAQHRFNDIIRAAQDGEVDATPFEAALLARDYVFQMEDEFWTEVAENPDSRERIEADFQEMFGYLPRERDEQGGKRGARGAGGGAGTDRLSDVFSRSVGP